MSSNNSLVQLTFEQAVKKMEELKIEQKRIENELKLVKPIVENEMPLGENLVTERGFFFMKSRSNWKFSEELESLQEEIKERKKEEIRTGVAEETPVPYLEYRQGKPKTS